MLQKSLSFAIAVSLACLCVSDAAPNDRTVAKEDAPPEDFARNVHGYLRAKFKGEAEPFYADAILLLPGHEYLKAEHGISPDGDRSKAVMATRKQVVDVDKSGSGNIPPEKVEALIGRMKLETTRVTDDEGLDVGGEGRGEKMTIPSHPGDVVVVARFEGMDDCLAFVFRQIEGEWKVAAEYLD